MSDFPPVPYPGSYWVIPGTLLASVYPGGHDETSTDVRLNALLDAGIRSVIDLMEEEEELLHESGEIYLPYQDRLEALAEKREAIVEIGRYAIQNGTIPPDSEMRLILDAIDAEIDGRNSPTMVHCSNANGRTGAVIGCYLARHDIAVGKEALAKMKELRSSDAELATQRSPENIVGEKFVLRWKVGQ